MYMVIGGLGRAMAVRFANCGADIVAAARTVAQLEETAALVRQGGRKCLVVPTDVGKSAFIVSLPAEQKAAGSSLQVNSGDNEGTVVPIDIPAVSAVNLGVNEVIVSTDLENQAAEYRIDYAIGALGGIRAQVGAQTVSLNMAAQANQTASVDTQASESAIRDVNVGQTATQFVRDQILTNFQTRLVADSNRLSQIYATLVSDALVR